MLQKVLTQIFGTKHERDLKKLQPILDQVNQLGEETGQLREDQLKAKTAAFRERVDRGEDLDSILPEAFAVVREVAIRELGERPYDVQVLGAVVLHQGRIAEMKTGEGKTLTSTMPLYLNALTGRGAHLATVNDYLAKRDAEWMGKIYNYLGLTVGVTLSSHEMAIHEKRAAYQDDITYGIATEFGFDYLRDNMAQSLEGKCQRELYYAIVDEVDSVLIDEARTPLIISDRRGESTQLYKQADTAVRRLKLDVHYEIDEENTKRGHVALTEEGVSEIERKFGVGNLYEHTNIQLVHHVNQALTAHALYKRDVDYVVQTGEVVIVDEFTGRLQPGRRYSDGLHQALEAKERVRIVDESQTIARTSYQNYFRMYEKLAGMTGTAETESAEFHEIYQLDVAVIPTNVPVERIDSPDVVYKNEEAKYRAAIREIVELHEQGRPILVGTSSIENSERLSNMLRKDRIIHRVLNAKEHAREAEIIMHAGERGAVTIATNMAGRGVDIKLSDEVKSLGGLHILGTERHESRRIDNQLRGRSGRQGDTGSSRFYLSLEDELMRKFGSDRLSGIMDRVGMEEDVPIEHKLVTRAIEKAQKRVEERHFDYRKQVLKFDDVMNTQREVLYQHRDSILAGEDLKGDILEMLEELIDERLETYIPPKSNADDWDIQGLIDWVRHTYTLDMKLWTPEPGNMTPEEISERLLLELRKLYDGREESMGAEIMRTLERLVMLDRIDNGWMNHLANIDYLEEGIGLRGYGGKDPIVVFKQEAFDIFMDMIHRFKEEVTEGMFKYRLVTEDESAQRHRGTRQSASSSTRTPLPRAASRAAGRRDSSESDPPAIPSSAPKVGRNEPCPCGSGKKYKKCCGS